MRFYGVRNALYMPYTGKLPYVFVFKHPTSIKMTCFLKCWKQSVQVIVRWGATLNEV